MTEPKKEKTQERFAAALVVLIVLAIVGVFVCSCVGTVTSPAKYAGKIWAFTDPETGIRYAHDREGNLLVYLNPDKTPMKEDVAQ